MSLLSSLLNNMMGQTASETKSGNEEGNDNIRTPDLTMNSNAESKTGEEPSGISKLEDGSTSCRNPLEWKFIDFTKAKRSPVFDVDPVMLKKFIGHNVTVLSISRQEYKGCCLAIDPVSLSVILAKRVDGGKIRVITVPGYYLSTIRVDSNSVPSENSVSVNDLDVAELYHAPSLYSENKSEIAGDGKSNGDKSQQSHLAPNNADCMNQLSPDEVSKRKQNLIDLLMKHRMPVTVKEDILEIPGGIKIRPPYTIDCCDTANLIIKKKLGELIKSL